jgi:hypothetical protein
VYDEELKVERERDELFGIGIHMLPYLYIHIYMNPLITPATSLYEI